MDDLEEIRRRKLQEYQKRQASAPEEAMERLLQQILEPEARERLTRIRMSRPDFADLVVRQLVALARAGRLPRRLTDAELRQVLAQLQPSDRDSSITRR
jgi:programmed cell death protein 5